MRAPTIPELVRPAVRAGVRFRLRGARVHAENPQRAEPVMAALRASRDEVWAYLGGKALDQPSLDLMAGHFGNIRIVMPQDEVEALAAIAQIEAEADRQADPAERGLLGFDIETAANDGEEVRQPVRIGRDGTVRQRPALDPPHLRRPNKPRSTAGLDPWRSTIRLAQLYGGGDTCLVLDTRLVPLGVLAPVLSRRKLLIHSAGFELRFLRHAGIALPQFECTMQAAGLMLGVHSRSLEDAARHSLGIDVPKDLQLSDWGATVLSPGQLAYAALDALIALRLWPLLRQEMPARGRAYLLQRDAIPAVVRMQARGLLLDRIAHQKEMDRWALARSSACRDFTACTGELPPETPAQIRRLLENTLPPEVLRAWPRTAKSGELSTADKDLKRPTGIPELDLVRTIRTQEKLLSTFGASLAARAADDGRIHASFNLAGAKTGRMRCSDPNLQQMPRDPAFRNCFVAAPGKVLIVADYSTMELRAAAEIYGDAILRQDFADGVDPHRRLAAQMYGIPEDEVTREQRQAAKPINFGTIYGAGGKGLAASAWSSYGIEMTPREAQAARDRFLGRYRGLARGMLTNAHVCQRLGYIAIGKYGRVIKAEWETAPPDRHSNSRADDGGDCVGKDEDADDDDNGDCGFGADAGTGRGWWPQQRVVSPLKYTLCCNAPIQGACADIIMWGTTLFDRAMIDVGIDGGLVLSVHDELVAEVKEEHAAHAAKLLVRVMVQAFAEYFPTAPVNGLVEVHIVRAWGEAKK
jgi:DNA polymerase-1